MSFGGNDNPVLVAPRPVRLTTAPYNLLSRAQSVRLVSAPAADSLERVHALEELKLGLFTESTSEKELGSPRSSPRSALPSEALEEFLSILRPSFFPPRSPVRNRRSLPAIQHERSFSYKGRARIEAGVEEIEIARSTQPSRNNRTPDSATSECADGSEFQFLDLDDMPFRWFASNVLSSPISRNHTRNPFQRHATYPLTASPHAITPLPTLSPAAIPLPLPTPDEMLEIP